MRASHEFSERDQWVSTTRAHLTPPVRQQRKSLLGPLVRAGIVVTVLAFAAKYALMFAKVKGWL